MKFPAVVMLLCVIGCSHTNGREPEYSFYYWKTSFASDSNSVKYIEKEKINHFYVRYFDVAWMTISTCPHRCRNKSIQNAAPFVQSHFTPVVFITNRCLGLMQQNWCDSLAQKVSNKIAYITNRLLEANPGAFKTPDEIQIDCDWTASTKEKYFSFLKRFKELHPDKIISATIRLFPYKYADKMGVPPVDRGLLMCYNLTNIKDADDENSVFKLNDLKQYLVANKYPLPLDIALPVFGWYAWFSQNKFMGIIYPEKNDSFKTIWCFQKSLLLFQLMRIR